MQAVVGRAAGDHSLKHVDEPGFRVEPIESCRLCRAPNYAERARCPQDLQ